MQRNFAASSAGNSVLALSLAAGLLLTAASGCSMIPALQRKFIRKPKHRPAPPVAVMTRDYEEDITPEDRYRRHYMMWDFWHAEILEGLGSARKKALRATDEAINELTVMQSMLWAPQAQKLTPHVARLQRLQQELTADALSSAAVNRWRTELERQQRVIHREFAWSHVEDYLAPAHPTPPPPLPDAPSAAPAAP